MVQAERVGPRLDGTVRVLEGRGYETSGELSFPWEIQAGPEMKIAYEAIINDGVWTETGTRIPKTGEPVKFIEFSVTRLGDSAWPSAGALPPKG